METIINVQDLSQMYGQKLVFEKVSFTIHSGAIVGLLGPNGAGKTTLLKNLLGLQQSTAGHITILQHDPRAKSLKDKIGVMFQDDLIMKRVRARELLELMRSLYSTPLTMAQLAQIADLGEDINNYVNKLSGGQQRKLNFALALVGNPQLLFLDEPTVGMDTTSRHHFWKYIQKLTNQGKTIIVTSHYLAEIEDIATQILFLKDQHLIHDGSLPSLRQQFGQNIVEFTSNLVAEQLQISTAKLQSHQGQHYQFVVNDVDKFLQELAPQMGQVHDLQIKHASLDDIFSKINEE